MNIPWQAYPEHPASCTIWSLTYLVQDSSIPRHLTSCTHLVPNIPWHTYPEHPASYNWSVSNIPWQAYPEHPTGASIWSLTYPAPHSRKTRVTRPMSPARSLSCPGKHSQTTRRRAPGRFLTTGGTHTRTTRPVHMAGPSSPPPSRPSSSHSLLFSRLGSHFSSYHAQLNLLLHS